MPYKVINEELKIAICSISDLTMKQVESFLKLWNDDSKIGTLTMFYDNTSEYLILNEDNKDFQLYLDVAEGYLKANTEQRKAIYKESPASMRETLRVLEGFRQIQFAKMWINRAKKSKITNFEIKMLSHIVGPLEKLTAYNLGVIKGKRIERARRKR